MESEVLSSGFTITLDDDPIIGSIVERSTGLKSRVFPDSKQLFHLDTERDPIGIFVDIHLEGGECGLDIIPLIRKRWSRSPIIVMTGDSDDEVIGNALAAGANDFIRKPINPKELTARLQARVIEMNRRARDEELGFGDVTLNFRRRLLESHGKTRYLSPTECSLLETLIDARGMVIPRAELKRKVWGNVIVSDNALDRKIFEVRAALKDLKSQVTIVSMYGVGLSLKFDGP